MEGITLDNRELSFLIWGIIAFIFMLFKKNIRRNIFDIIKIIFTPKILLSNLIMLFYVIVIIYFLSIYNIWDKSLLKGTLLWLFFIAIPLFFKANRANQQEYYFRTLLKENLKIIIIIEFLTNLYVFNFLLEFLLIPVAVLLGGMSAFSERDNKYLPAKKFSDYSIGLLGIISIIYVLYNVVSDFGSFANYDNLKSLLLPILLTILFIPAIYFQALFMNYGLTYVRLGAFCKDISLLKYIKFKMVMHCNINLFRAKKFANGLIQFNYENKQKFIESLKSL